MSIIIHDIYRGKKQSKSVRLLLQFSIAAKNKHSPIGRIYANSGHPDFKEQKVGVEKETFFCQNFAMKIADLTYILCFAFN
jgi:hypothetical protein